MKIYHKFLLYQNKLLKPYVRILLGLVEALTYLASLLLIVGVIYEHGCFVPGCKGGIGLLTMSA